MHQAYLGDSLRVLAVQVHQVGQASDHPASHAGPMYEDGGVSAATKENALIPAAVSHTGTNAAIPSTGMIKWSRPVPDVHDGQDVHDEKHREHDEDGDLERAEHSPMALRLSPGACPVPVRGLPSMLAMHFMIARTFVTEQSRTGPS